MLAYHAEYGKIVYVTLPQDCLGAEIRRIMVKARPGRIVLETCLEKHPTQKMADGVTQAVEHLCSKHKVLSSNPVLPKILIMLNESRLKFHLIKKVFCLGKVK
jgi:hypothetical protein